MNKELNNNFIDRIDKNIKKTDEIALFKHIYNAYFNSENLTVVSSNFYLIKDKVYICDECGNSIFNLILFYISIQKQY